METGLGMKAKYLYLNMILRNFLCTLTSTKQSYLDHLKIPWGYMILFQVQFLSFILLMGYKLLILHKGKKILWNSEKSQMRRCFNEWWAWTDFRISSVETALQQTAFTFRLWIIVSAYGQEIWGPDIEAKNYGIWKLLGQELAFDRVLVNTTWEHITHNAFSQHLIYLAKASFKQCYTL